MSHLTLVGGTEARRAKRSPVTARRPGRLTEYEEADVRFYFGEYESLLGVRCTHEEMVASIQGLRGTTGDIAYEMPIVRALEGGRSVNEFTRVMDRARRVHARLKRMPPKLAVVIHRIYGMKPPGDLRTDVFGDLAPIVEYTHAVDMRREAMISEAIGERLARLSAHDWWAKTTTFRQEATIHAIGLGAEREISTGDALRAIIADPDDVDFSTNVAAIRIEAEALLKVACESYRSAGR